MRQELSSTGCAAEWQSLTMQRAADRESSVKEREAENTKMQNNLLHIKNENYEAENDFVFRYSRILDFSHLVGDATVTTSIPERSPWESRASTTRTPRRKARSPPLPTQPATSAAYAVALYVSPHRACHCPPGCASSEQAAFRLECSRPAVRELRGAKSGLTCDSKTGLCPLCPEQR